MRILHRAIASAICSATLLGGGQAQSQVTPQTNNSSYTLDIPSQNLSSALQALALASQHKLLYRAALVEGKKSPAINGSYTMQQAMQALLSGTDLTFEVTATAVVLIRGKGEFKSGEAGKNKDTLLNLNGEQILPGDAAGTQLLLAQMTPGEMDAADAADGKAKKTGRSADNVEEMIVEESKIKPFADANIDIPRTINDSQPYYIFDSETIERSAAMNVEEFLKQRLTMNSTAQTTSQQAINTQFGGNSSSINLRGLGADKTLVLVNGRRIASPSLNNTGRVDMNTQSDLNGIPLSAIDRIEVLPSSASGIYGGGAIGGVINVILKRNYTGGEVRASFDNTWDTDSPNRSVGATYGVGLGKTQVMFTAQWADSKSLLMQDRRELFDRGIANIRRNGPSFLYSNTSPFLGVLPNITSTSETIYNPDGSFNRTIADPGTLTLKNGQALGSRFTHISAGTTPNISLADLSAQLYANRDVWNLDLPATPQNPTGLLRASTVTPRNSSFMLSVTRELRPGMDLKLDLASRTNNSVNNSSGLPTSMTISASNPNNPFTSAVLITHPASLAVLSSAIDIGTDSISLGLSSRLPHRWIAQADFTWSQTKSKASYSPGTPTVNFYTDVDSGAFDLFTDVLNHPYAVAQALLDHRFFYNNSSTIGDLSLRGSGPLFELPWGTPNLTLGLEHRVARSPRVAFIASELPGYDPGLSNFNLITFAREQASDSVYGEMLIPLVKANASPLVRALELQLSGRTERYIGDAGTTSYQDFGNGSLNVLGPTINGQAYFTKSTYATTNSTIGIKYMPLAELIIRLSMANAFLPPSANQLLRNPLPNANPTTVSDPRNNNSLFSVRTVSGGNPDLVPQNSESFNAGIIWQPESEALNGLRLNAEYYNIKQFDAIGSLSAQALINDEAAYPGRVVRNAAGIVTFVDTSSLNLYRRETEGWDLSADYTVKTGAGTFDIHGVGSVILGLRNQSSFTLPMTDAVGFPSEGGAAKYKSNLQINWSYKNWMAGWSAVYFGSYKQNGALGGPSATSRRATNPTAALSTTYTGPQGSDTIPSQMYHDLYISYAFDKRASGRSLGRAFGAEMLSGVTAQFGVKNVFDTLPPFDVFYDYYISPYGNTRLRSYWLSVKKAF